MNEIQQWLGDRQRDYDQGVQLYMNSEKCKSRTLQTLKRGKSARNISLLLSELRKIKNTAIRTEKFQPKPKPVKKLVKKAQDERKPVKQVSVTEKKVEIGKSTENEFVSVRMGDLPKELRPRFKHQKTLFYDMCELKLQMNETPREENTLKIQLAIEALDEEIDLIWKEIDHWIKFKTLLPRETEEDFSKIPPAKLYLKKANLHSNITKVQKRIETQKENYKKETNRDERVKIKSALNKSLKTLHKNELNLIKITELLS